jgi:hypothetical protein
MNCEERYEDPSINHTPLVVSATHTHKRNQVYACSQLTHFSLRNGPVHHHSLDMNLTKYELSQNCTLPQIVHSRVLLGEPLHTACTHYCSLPPNLPLSITRRSLKMEHPPFLQRTVLSATQRCCCASSNLKPLHTLPLQSSAVKQHWQTATSMCAARSSCKGE